MNLLEAISLGGRCWTRVGNNYEVTKKPRGLDVTAIDTIPFAPMESIPNGGAYYPRYRLKSPSEIKSGTYFERGNILVAKITPSFENGKQALTTNLPARFGYATTEAIPLRSRNAGHDHRLLFFYLLHPEVRQHVADRMEGATGRQRIPIDVLLDVPYPDFALDEQLAIANLLEMIQLMIAVEVKSIDTAVTLKKAAMKALFTHGLRGELVKPKKIYHVPQSWEIHSIGDLACQVQYGLSMRGHQTGLYPILRMNCQDDGKVVLRDLQYVDLDDSTAAAYKVRRGDILFNRTNSYDLVGRTAIVETDIEAVFASYLLRISINQELVIPEFVNQFLNWEFVQSLLKRLASRGVSQANISASKLAEFVIPVPALQEQQQITSILDLIDVKIGLHRRKRDVLQSLFTALLHSVMVGSISHKDLRRFDIERILAIPRDSGHHIARQSV